MKLEPVMRDVRCRWVAAGLAVAGSLLGIPALGAEAASPPATELAAAGRVTFGWKQIETPEYAAYLDRLRAAGCPEERIRVIVRMDADEWLLQARVELAVKNDFAWWKDAPSGESGDAFGEAYGKLQAQRRELVSRLLGVPEEEPEVDGQEAPIVVNLSGPVLGAMSRDKYDRVQEICRRSMDRQQGYFNARQNEGVFLNQGDLADMREQTRADLSEFLSAEELEEFLLRYSHNSNRLRIMLAGLEPTPEEFRAVFRAVDSLEHRVQLEFGAIDSLSARQREDFERRREEAIKGVLPPERYQRYLIGRYPLFRQAQLAIRRAGLPDGTVVPFYEALNEHESRKREVLNNSALNPQQRQIALQSLETDKENAIRRALGDEGYRQYRDSLVN